jgi:hypothetical protein
MNLDPMTFSYLARQHEPTPEAQHREAWSREQPNRTRKREEPIEPERRRAAMLLRERAIVRLGRFFA